MIKSKHLVVLLAALGSSMATWADHRLPDQPVAADGSYIVKWDWTTNDFAASNDMEYDETFVFAVNLHGTVLGDWVMQNPTNAGAVRTIAFDKFRQKDDPNTQYDENAARLWHIRDTIFGATFNFAQIPLKNGSTYTPTIGSITNMCARLFGVETPFGNKCGPNATGTDWWIWPGAWSYNYTSANDQYLFRFAPYTGTKTSVAFNTQTSDDEPDIYYDVNHYVYCNGYCSPQPMTYPTNYGISASTTVICPLRNESGTITIAGTMTGYQYMLYKDGKPLAGTTKSGNGAAQSWTVSQLGTYSVYYCETGNQRYVKNVPCTGADEITLASDNTCCEIGNVVVTITPTNPGVGEQYTVTATCSEDDGISKTFTWTCNGSPVTTTFTNTATTSSFTATQTADGWFTYNCVVKEPGKTCEEQGQQQIHVELIPICPVFTWAIDGTEGLTTPMYPGGWYDVSCSTPAGAPTLTITGTGITTVAPTTQGTTTTVRVTLQAGATGDITMTAASPANTALNYKACSEVMTPTVAACDERVADTRKIEWFNYVTATESWPQYWYKNGAQVYLRDNNGHMEADIAHTDGQDEWYFIPTGATAYGQPVYYIQNALTRRYLYRGSTMGNVGGAWEYSEALLSATNLQTTDYQWIFYPYNGKTAIVCLTGFTGSNLTTGAYVLHTRLWEATGLFSNPPITTPGMACGKMDNQHGSPVFWVKAITQPQNAAFSGQPKLSWNGTAPAATITVDNGDNLTYTASRTDQVHSINTTIHYESSNPAVATVNATTGAVSVVGTTGSTVISVILEDVGCFLGDTLTYTVTLYECGDVPTLSSNRTTMSKSEHANLTIGATLAAGETGEIVYTAQPAGSNPQLNGNQWSADRDGVYTFYYRITNTAHPDCNRQSLPISITLDTPPVDHRLPDQPVAADGSYIVKWDCQKNDFADANDMEYDETFVFAVNLHNTPLGDWLQGTPAVAGMVRSVAFDKWRDRKIDGTQYKDGTARLWHIRDTIYGAVFNFAQLQMMNGTNARPANGAITKIAARLFGVENGFGAKCGAPGITRNGQWWQWSNNSSGWNGGSWLEDTYTSHNDEYLFAFLPYTGTKTGAPFVTTDDDSRDIYYDKDHYVSSPGYGVPCPKQWPEDQALSTTTGVICMVKGETATISTAASQPGWTYVLYKNGTAVSGSEKAGNGGSLNWTVSEGGTYTVYALLTDATSQHSDWMGDCSNTASIQITEDNDCADPEPECAPVEHINDQITVCDTIMPYTWHEQTLTAAGTYTDTLRCKLPLSNGIICDSIIWHLTLTVQHCERDCEELIYRKWDDLLFVDNGGNRFVAYQWYQNNTPITGANKQYLYTQGTLLSNDGNTYYCIATCADGTRVTACAHAFNDFPASAAENPGPTGKMKLTPNPCPRGTNVSIEGIGSEIHCLIFNSVGSLIDQFDGDNFSAFLPAGCYLVKATDTDGNIYADKLIVR